MFITMKSTPVLFALVLKLVSCSLEPGVIQTKTGLVQGTEFNNSFGKLITAYTNIPYAEAPIGPLRFKPPVPVNPWSGVLQSSSNFSTCIQQHIPGFANFDRSTESITEDCLHLNIMVPTPAPTNSPVLVFIHAGAFSVGRALQPIGSMGNIVSEENLILVSMNYRLNIFGFMSLGSPEVPGNMGLMDQRLAFKWIKENIEAFGGDSNSITAFGLSAGAISTSYHILANKNKDLFHRAIMMSGTVSDAGHAEPEHMIAKTLKLTSAVGCPSKNVELILECLANVSAQDLLTADNKLRMDPQDFFRPTVDGTYIMEDPRISLAAGRFSTVPVLIGVTSNEGGRFAYMGNRELFTGADDAVSPEGFSKASYRLLGPDANRVTLEALAVFYKNYSNPDDQIMLRDAAGKAYGDYIFVCGTNNFCDDYAKSGNTVYKYVYDQKIFALTSSNWFAPDHGSDFPVVLGLALGSPVLSEKEEEFSRQMMRHWGNFIRTGDPNGAGNYTPQWPKYNLVHKPHMRLTFQPHVEGHFHVAECSFWNVLLPSLRTANKCKQL